MAKIHLLDRQVAELIAAGEVVERPASIVKELLENAIDAGATAITVEIQGGGIRYIRITDNGSGIAREDVPNAFLRHATSKVRQEEDLYRILTMGFRGEALASIAAMCRVELLTRMADELSGTSYQIAGGEEQSCADAGCPVGTTIIVRDVFFNTPARMKFLKRDVSEGNSVAAAVEKLALGNPGVSIKFLRDGVVKLQTPGDGKVLSAIRCILGKELAENAIPVTYENSGLRVAGYICKPQAARGSRAMQNFFINTRFIHSRTCMAALEQAYKNALMVGKFPYCVLDLTIPPQTVDVNVHPAKIEVRFADENRIFELVYYGCKTALGASALQPELELHAPPQPVFNPFAAHTEKTPPRQQMSVQDYRAMMAAQAPQPTAGRPLEWTVATSAKPAPITPSWKLDVQTPPEPKRSTEPLLVASDGPEQMIYSRSVPANAVPALIPATAPPTAPEPESETPAGLYENVRLVGELFSTYLLLENENELLLVDKHAAHERLLFNQLVREGVGEERQLLLTPVSVRLSQEEADAVLEQRELLERMGLSVEDFGNCDILVREVAPILAKADIPAILAECAQKLLVCSTRLLPRELEDFYHIVACRAAIKAHDRTPAPSLEELIRLLSEDGDADHCPHGRPVAVKIRRQEIEKRFGRLG